MNTVFEVLNARYEEEMVALKNFIIQGKAASFEEYRSACGQIRGLAVAQHINNDLANQYKDKEDE